MFDRVFIDVTADDVAALRDHGPGWALMWDGADVIIRPIADSDDGSLMQIGDYDSIAQISEFNAEDGRGSDDEDLADDYTDIANDYLASWGDERRLMPLIAPISRALRDHGITRIGGGLVGWRAGGPCQVTQLYRTPNTDTRAEITVTGCPGDPIELAVSGHGRTYTAFLNPGTPARTVAARFVAAARAAR
ncbi:hypothetical protein [Microtetraspora malaysiensis]|uniref:hypothetical protein n=1 Tax=Microtetraspora malaysiensis TaxID=161358 RepID=UPI00082FC0B3|nr:hypothetical protein [Microtetraspora malaysiensis]